MCVLAAFLFYYGVDNGIFVTFALCDNVIKFSNQQSKSSGKSWIIKIQTTSSCCPQRILLFTFPPLHLHCLELLLFTMTCSRDLLLEILICTISSVDFVLTWYFNSHPAKTHEISSAATALAQWCTSWSPNLLPLVKTPGVHPRGITYLLDDALLEVQDERRGPVEAVSACSFFGGICPWNHELLTMGIAMALRRLRRLLVCVGGKWGAEWNVRGQQIRTWLWGTQGARMTPFLILKQDQS